MSDKLKRNYHYRRWWAFRGLLVALILFFGIIAYFLTRQPEAEYVIYQVRYSDESIKRVNVDTGETELLISADDSQIPWIQKTIYEFVVSGDGQTVVYTEIEPDFGMRVYVYDIQLKHRNLLFDCTQWRSYCYLEVLNSDGSKLIFSGSGTSERLWYEFDISNGELLPLTQSDNCLSQSVVQSLIVLGNCGFQTSQIINYEMQDVTRVDNILQILFADNLSQYAYRVPREANVDQFGNMLPTDVFVGQWDNESSIHLVGSNVANVLEDWHPDNKRLLFSRYTVEYDADGGYEFALYDIETREATNLLYRRGARLSQAQWNAAGTKFIYVMNPMYGMQPELTTNVWVYDLASGETSVIGYGGMSPQWAN